MRSNPKRIHSLQSAAILSTLGRIFELEAWSIAGPWGHVMASQSAAETGEVRFVALEGVDGTGKSTFASALAAYQRTYRPTIPLYAGSFPGATPGTLGEWVYRLHHSLDLQLTPSHIAPPALQLLHIAAHVDSIESQIKPMFERGGSVILDRYWWSTYAYSRVHIPPDQAWALVTAELPFWDGLPQPEVIYLTRRSSLKPQEIALGLQNQIASHYAEVIERELAIGSTAHQISNDGTVDECWRSILDVLHLPYQPMT